MLQLIILLRTMHLYYHQVHHVVGGPNFFADHAFLDGVYNKTNSWYDSVVERFVGQDNDTNKLDLNHIIYEVSELLSEYPINSDPEHLLSQGLTMEKSLCEMIALVSPNVSEGTKQLIGDIANESEVRQYLLQRRLLSGGKAQ